jgi:transposase-like protein
MTEEDVVVTCPKCRVSMKEQKGIFHNKRKFKCPKCGKVRMKRHRKR